MGDEDDRLVEPGLQSQQLVLEPAAHDGVDGSERLVHQHHRRVGGERSRHPHPLPLPAAQFTRVALGHSGIELDQLHQLRHPLRDPGSFPAEELGHDGDVLGDGLVGEEPYLLDDVADAPPQLVRLQRRDVAARHRDGTAGRFDQPVDHLERRGLAASGRPDEDGDVPLRHVEGEVVHGRGGRSREGLADPLEADHGLRHANDVRPW